MQKPASQIRRQAGNIKEQGSKAREKRVLELVIRAYNKTCEEKRYPTKKHEERFSAILLGCIDEIIPEYARKTGHQWHAQREYYNDNQQIRMGQENPRNAPRIDILITCWKGYSGERHKYSFESKRLKEDDNELIKDYIRDGLKDRYLTDKNYSAGSSWGGMIGYILQGSHSSIVTKLNEQIDLQMGRPEEHLFLLKPIESLESIYKSQHQRPNATGTLSIVHLLLAFILIDNDINPDHDPQEG